MPSSQSGIVRKAPAGLLIYLAVLSLLGAGVLYAATSKWGPGVSTDAAVMMSTAESLAQGRGLVDYAGRELTQFPPLYPALLALGRLIFGMDVFTVGWVLNIVIFAALIAGTGLYLYSAFSDEPILAYAGGLVVLTSVSVIRISANIASDPLFMLMVLAFLLLSSAYLRTSRRRYLAAACAVAMVACLQRYAGLSLVLAGGLIALYAMRQNSRRAAIGASLFVVVGAAPMIAWGLLHNLRFGSDAFGHHQGAIPAINIETGAEKMLYWFLPHNLISAVGPLQLLTVIALAIAAAFLLWGRARILQNIQRPEVPPSIAFLFVYWGMLIFDISSFEHKGLLTDRLHIVTLPPLLTILGVVVSQLLTAVRRRVKSPALTWGLAAIVLVWAVYPGSKTYEYVSQSVLSGDVSPYNSINKSDLRDAGMSESLRALGAADQLLYSNGPDSVWFITRRPVSYSPTLSGTDRMTELREKYGDWPAGGRDAYLVWMLTEAHKTSYATPGELASIASLQELYTFQYATVYAVRSQAHSEAMP